MQHSHRLIVALVTALGLILTSVPGLAHAADWTDANTKSVNYRQKQDKVRKEILSELNRMRSSSRKCGDEKFPAVPKLALNTALSNAAYRHSKDMAARDYFSHTSQDGTTFDERVTAAGYTWTAVGENIAAGQRNAGSVVADWMSSPGHCRNIMSKSFTHLGVGVYYDANSSYGIYWTNDFGKGKSKAVSDVVPRALTVAVPKISGTAKVGKKLTAKAGAWGPKPVTLTYQWYRNGKKIAKATTSTYTLKAADKGKKITVKVTGKKKGYATASKTSKPTSKVA